MMLKKLDATRSLAGRSFYNLYTLSLILIVSACSISKSTADLSLDHTVEIEELQPVQKLEKTACPSSIGKDVETKDLLIAIENSLNYYRLVKYQTFTFGDATYSADEMINSMNLFQRLVIDPTWGSMNTKLVTEYFDCYKPTSNGKKAVFTGYYTPLIDGSNKKTADYQVPVYDIPKNLNVLNLGQFRESLKGRTIVYKLNKNKVIPYDSREEIVAGNLDGIAEEVAYLADEVDFFFLQIQGSGIIENKSGKRFQLSYAGSNGRDYRSIGSLLVKRNIYKLEDVNLFTLKDYLRKNPVEVNSILNYNDSYVFFKLRPYSGKIIGSINQPLTGMRSAAFDSQLLPKGSLVFVETKIPNCDNNGKCKKDDLNFNRFVFNQDTGGAIKGFKRMDLYCGIGQKAEAISGKMRQEGDFYFIVAKKQYVK